MSTDKEIHKEVSDPDELAFGRVVSQYFKDERISGYFDGNYVDRDAVLNVMSDNDTFGQSKRIPTYESYDDLRDELDTSAKRIGDVIENGAINFRTIFIFFSVLSIVLLALTSLAAQNVGKLLTQLFLLLVPTICFAAIGLLLSMLRNKGNHRPRYIIASLALIALSLAALTLPQVFFRPSWRTPHPAWLYANCVASFIDGLFFAVYDETLSDCSQCIDFAKQVARWVGNKLKLNRVRDTWLEASGEEVVLPSAVLAINTVLGANQDKLLVEQNSEGLRRLQDQTLTVSTRSEERISDVLRQMDGGSIALAGPRGAGKSTLLRKFCSMSEKAPGVGIPVYVTAPAEYVPRDFLAELFQRLCEAYLAQASRVSPGKLYTSPKIRRGALRYTRSAFLLLWLALRAIVALALIALIAGSYIIRIHIVSKYHAMIMTSDHWRSLAYKIGLAWWSHDRILVVICALLLAVIIWPRRRKWRARFRQMRGSTLANRALEYLQRLRIDKTFTWGANLSSPSVNGMGFRLNRGASFSYIPWSLPELVGQIRGFIEDISREMRDSAVAVIVGIDEIDRIGSLDHAERFIGEIKAIFGVERCFFLVSVAEDVGSLFAQRATAGRSILENAFDDIIVIEPLTLQEAQELLLKRVPGFTESFVYLVHALSGGLPRELIRVTRRLVEVNHEPTEGTFPLIGDLAYALVKEELIESLRAARTQMARLSLDSQWASLFDGMHAAITKLRSEATITSRNARVVIDEVSELQPPEPPKRLSREDERNARTVIDRLSASAYFGKTIIDAFANDYFNLESVRRKTLAGCDGAYAELAVARIELSISPSSSRRILTRFRSSL